MSKKVELSVEVTAWADPGYRYHARVGGENSLVYEEDGRDQNVEITFGSLDEMESAARAMLHAVESARKLGIS